MDLKSLCEALADTPPSRALQEALWAVPAIQSVHILALSVVLASMCMFGLRLAGVAGRAHSLAGAARLFIPPTWLALVVLFCSGLLLILAEPKRELLNPAFRWKMALLVVAISSLALVQRRLGRADDEGRGLAGAVPVGLVLAGLWVAIAVLGRWIAYQDTGL